MRRSLFLTLFAAILFTACEQKNTATEDGPAQKNLRAARAIADAFSTGNTAGIDSFVSDDFVDHRHTGDVRGKDSLKAYAKLISSDKNMKMELLSETADSNYVFQWMNFTGMDEAPNGMKMIEVTRFKDGKAVEHWGYADFTEMMKMMATPTRPAENKK